MFQKAKGWMALFLPKRLGGDDGDCGNQLGLNSFLPALSYKKIRPKIHYTPIQSRHILQKNQKD